jgi:hypothetical protein
VELSEDVADQVVIDVTSAELHAINQLREIGYADGYGTQASVVQFALRRFIDDCRRAGVVKPPPTDDNSN